MWTISKLCLTFQIQLQNALNCHGNWKRTISPYLHANIKVVCLFLEKLQPDYKTTSLLLSCLLCHAVTSVTEDKPYESIQFSTQTSLSILIAFQYSQIGYGFFRFPSLCPVNSLCFKWLLRHKCTIKIICWCFDTHAQNKRLL